MGLFMDSLCFLWPPTHLVRVLGPHRTECLQNVCAVEMADCGHKQVQGSSAGCSSAQKSALWFLVPRQAVFPNCPCRKHPPPTRHTSAHYPGTLYHPPHSSYIITPKASWLPQRAVTTLSSAPPLGELQPPSIFHVSVHTVSSSIRPGMSTGTGDE